MQLGAVALEIKASSAQAELANLEQDYNEQLARLEVQLERITKQRGELVADYSAKGRSTNCMGRGELLLSLIGSNLWQLSCRGVSLEIFCIQGGSFTAWGQQAL